MRGLCSIEGCGRPHQARSWCGYHWRRWRLYGDPEEPNRLPRWTPEETRKALVFLEDVEATGRRARAGEVDDLALMLNRSRASVAQKLYKMRQQRHEAAA